MATPCGATINAPVAFTSKLAINSHKFCDKKMLRKNSKSQHFTKNGHTFPLQKVFCCFFFHRKIVSLKIYEKLGIGYPRPRLFSVFRQLHHRLLFFCFFLAKMDRGYHNFSFQTTIVKIEHICWQKTIFSKNS